MTHHERFLRRKEIAQYINEGNSVNDASVRFKISEATVRSACFEFLGVLPDRRKSANELAPSTYKIIARLTNTGRELGIIAKEFGVSRQRITQIYHRCIEAGIPVIIRKQGPKKENYHAEGNRV
jgi:hypothetical protein